MQRSFFQRKSTRWILAIVIILVGIRLILPSLILNHMNGYLAEMSPLYRIHIQDLDLHIWRMAYSFDHIEGELKDKDKFQFMDIRRMNVSLAWRELFRGRFVADVDIKEADLKFTTASIQALSGYGTDKIKSDAGNVKDKTVPFDLERLRVMRSRALFADVGSLPPEQSFRLSQVEVLANNLTPQDEDAFTMFTVTGALQDKAKVKLVGQAHLKKNPAEWSLNVESRGFDLRDINPIAQRMVPMTFKTGELSFYLAARSMANETKGYVKPFFKNLVIIGDRKDFKNFKQFFLELGGTIGNFILKNRKTQTLATKIEFKKVGNEMKIDTAKAIELSFEHGFGDPLTPSLDETLDLK